MTGKTLNRTELNLIAPCGLNCGVCRAYLRPRNACPGCRGDDTVKAKTCVTCRIKMCKTLARGRLEYCSPVCSDFPCERLMHLDKRYRLKYGASPVENLRQIEKAGLAKFLRGEAAKWACPQCGETLCMHQPTCAACGYAWLERVRLTSA